MDVFLWCFTRFFIKSRTLPYPVQNRYIRQRDIPTDKMPEDMKVKFLYFTQHLKRERNLIVTCLWLNNLFNIPVRFHIKNYTGWPSENEICSIEKILHEFRKKYWDRYSFFPSISSPQSWLTFSLDWYSKLNKEPSDTLYQILLNSLSGDTAFF